MPGSSEAVREALQGATKLRSKTEKAVKGVGKTVSNTAKNATEKISKTVKEVGGIGSSENLPAVVREPVAQISKPKSGIGKNSLVGGAVGAVSGAGVGGITAMVSGADEDDTKSMIFMGALAGGTGGAMIGAGSKMIRNKSASGSFFAQATEAAEQMAKEGGKNATVNGGANGLFEKAKGGFSSIGDKIDDIGYTVQHNYTDKKGKEFYNILKDMEEAGDFENIDRNEFIKEYADSIKSKGATIGGGVQGMAMGAASGAVIGGISGGIDEDDTFIGGALKGGLIGGTLGGVGGAIGGYAGKNAKLINSAMTSRA